MKPFKAAIVGCGRIASGFADDPLMRGDVFTHAEAYTRCADTTLSAVVDTDADRLDRCAERWSVPGRYQGVDEMLSSAQPDIVSVCTPDETHYAVLRSVLERGSSVKAVLCEKPLAMSERDAEELVDLARRNGVLVAVNFMRRFAANMRAVRDFIARDGIGRLQAVHGWYTKGVAHNGSHWFDLLRFLTGEVEWVQAFDVLHDTSADPSLDVTLGLRSGAVATLGALDAKSYSLFEMDILGSRGRLQLLDSCFEVRLFAARPSLRYSGYVELQPESRDFGDRRNLLLGAVNNVVSALKSGAPLSCTGEDGLAAVRLAAAACESARAGSRVKIG
jgi:predicted dehydrogenase